jgi:hypothetical protein
MNIEEAKVYIGVLSPEYRSKLRHKNTKQTVWNCVTI